MTSPLESDYGGKLTTLIEAVPMTDEEALRFLATGIPPWQTAEVTTDIPDVEERELTDEEVLGILTADGFDPAQPRDIEGKWTDASPGSTVARIAVSGRDLLTDLAATIAHAQGKSRALDSLVDDEADPYGPREDTLLHGIAAQQGFDGKPRVVSSAEMDELISSGHTELFRGTKGRTGKTGAEMHEQLRTGSAYYGKGIYGNGMYFGSRQHAEGFADNEPGSVVRVALHPDARVGDYREIYKEWSTYVNGLFDSKQFAAMDDPARYAAAQGWDAYTTPEGSTVVLNRTALAVER